MANIHGHHDDFLSEEDRSQYPEPVDVEALKLRVIEAAKKFVEQEKAKGNVAGRIEDLRKSNSTSISVEFLSLVDAVEALENRKKSSKMCGLLRAHLR
jgi:hypothetical protein